LILVSYKLKLLNFNSLSKKSHANYQIRDFPKKDIRNLKTKWWFLYYEQLFGTEGFHGHLCYIMFIALRKSKKLQIVLLLNLKLPLENIKSLLLKGFELARRWFFRQSKAMLVNKDYNQGWQRQKSCNRLFL
jgi:homogentisate 1,2-dioxygenase